MERPVILALLTLFGLAALVRAESLNSLMLAGQYTGDGNVLNKPSVMYSIAALGLMIPLIRLFRAVENYNYTET